MFAKCASNRETRISAFQTLNVLSSHAWLCNASYMHPYPHGEDTAQGFQPADSIHVINLLTSGLFTVNTMWTN